MTAGKRWASLGLAVSSAGLGAAYLAGARVPEEGARQKYERSRVALKHELPHLKGDSLTVTVVEVNYGPGEASTPHTHPCPVVGYVVHGTIRSQVEGEPETTYRSGETFYEAPGGVHRVSANASKSEPARFLAYFVCDHAAPLSDAVTEGKP